MSNSLNVVQTVSTGAGQKHGIRELRKLASELGVRNYSKLRKPELEQAIAATQGNPQPEPQSQVATSQDGKRFGMIGEANGHVVVVTQESTRETVGRFLGTMNKGDARKVRKLLRANGHSHLAGSPRIVQRQPERVSEAA